MIFLQVSRKTEPSKGKNPANQFEVFVMNVEIRAQKNPLTKKPPKEKTP